MLMGINEVIDEYRKDLKLPREKLLEKRAIQHAIQKRRLRDLKQSIKAKYKPSKNA